MPREPGGLVHGAPLAGCRRRARDRVQEDRPLAHRLVRRPRGTAAGTAGVGQDSTGRVHRLGVLRGRGPGTRGRGAGRGRREEAAPRPCGGSACDGPWRCSAGTAAARGGQPSPGDRTPRSSIIHPAGRLAGGHASLCTLLLTSGARGRSCAGRGAARPISAGRAWEMKRLVAVGATVSGLGGFRASRRPSGLRTRGGRGQV